MGGGCIRFHHASGAFCAAFVLVSETDSSHRPTREVCAGEGVRVTRSDFFEIDFLSTIDVDNGKS